MEPMVAYPGPTDKQAARRKVLSALAGMPSDNKTKQDEELVRVLRSETRQFEVVLATLPLGTEPDLTAFLTGWLNSGRRVALARTGPQRSLSFHYVLTLDGPWEPRVGGLREPPAQAPRWEPGPATLCLVPGLAFAPTADGWHRLGRGAGYYDRWLAVWHHGVTAWGVGYSLQRLPSVPVEPHDQKLSGAVFPEGLVSYASRPESEP